MTSKKNDTVIISIKPVEKRTAKLRIVGDSSLIVHAWSEKARKAAKLIKKLERLIPSLNFIEDFHWAGAFGITKDGLPFIGRQRDYPNAVFVLGFGGNGITFSVQAMELVLHALNGRSHLLLDMYRFDR